MTSTNTYRQIIKATNSLQCPEGFKNYLKLLYRKNTQYDYSDLTMNIWVKLLRALSQQQIKYKTLQKYQNQQTFNRSFVKHESFTMKPQQVTQLKQQIYTNFSHLDKETYQSVIQQFFNVYSMCQIYFLWQNKMFHPKNMNKKDVLYKILMRNKVFRLNNRQYIQFV